MNRHAADLDCLRSGNLASGDVAGQRARTYAQHLRCLSCGEGLHMWSSVPDVREDVKPLTRRTLRSGVRKGSSTADAARTERAALTDASAAGGSQL